MFLQGSESLCNVCVIKTNIKEHKNLIGKGIIGQKIKMMLFVTC